MSVTVHQRPGVYSSYDASSVLSGSAGGRLVGLAAIHATATAGAVQTITSYDRAVTAFGAASGQNMTELIRLALRNGASGVAAVPVSSAADTFLTLWAISRPMPSPGIKTAFISIYCPFPDAGCSTVRQFPACTLTA